MCLSKTTVLLSVFISVFCAFFLVQAGAGENVAGFSWSENIGWISFNSVSDGSGVDYGVNLDTGTGNFSGYAWSENIGWISFNESDTGTPPSDDPCGVGCIAQATPSDQLGESDVYISGWARALSYGGDWDGWIRFDHGQSGEAFIDANGDWQGWAWGSDVVGWVSLNGVDAIGGNYKVVFGDINQSPIVSNFDVSDGDSATYCGSAAHYFSWDYSDPDGDNESRFQFQVDNNSDFSSPEVNRDYSGLSNPSPTTNNQTVAVSESPSSDQIVYNTSYYWRVKVYDSEGDDSGWANGPSFTTESHRYPSIDFDWSPTEPSAEEDVLFADQSTVYGGASKSSWSWTFENGNPSSSSAQNPTIQFTGNGAQDVTLEMTDSDGYVCSKTQTVDTQENLPNWKEILPW